MKPSAFIALATLVLSLISPLPAFSAEGAKPEVADIYRVGDDIFVRSLAIDEQQGSLWVGVSVGAMEIDLESHKVKNTFTRDNSGLANEYVFGIGLDGEGNKWFGTDGGGVARYDNEKWTTYLPMHGLADYWIYTFATQKDGTFWIGTWAGANSFDPKTEKFTTYFDELINIWVYGLDVDSKDRVWFGTEGGVSMFDGQNWQQWNHDDGMGAPNPAALPTSTNTGLGTRDRHDLSIMSGGTESYNSNYCFTLYIDHDDNVWAGTWGGGAARFDGKEWKNFTMDHGLAGNLVYAITQDADGVFWFGTNHGVSRYDGETWQTLSRENGLINNSVYTIAVAPNGDVWAGTRGGVARIKVK